MGASEEKIFSTINSINEKTGDLIKSKDGVYYADERARDIFGNEFFDDLGKAS